MLLATNCRRAQRRKQAYTRSQAAWARTSAGDGGRRRRRCSGGGHSDSRTRSRGGWPPVRGWCEEVGAVDRRVNLPRLAYVKMAELALVETIWDRAFGRGFDKEFRRVSSTLPPTNQFLNPPAVLKKLNFKWQRQLRAHCRHRATQRSLKWKKNALPLNLKIYSLHSKIVSII